jgi:hypothetical protein
MSKNSTSSGGIGFAGLLAIVFITLKLTKHIDWSWWWVLSPILIPIAFLLVFLLIVGILFGIKHGLK